MNYDGQLFALPLGQIGLFTDAPQSNIPSSALIRANNVTFYNGVLQKDFGSRIWNSTPLPSSVRRATEFYPDAQSQNQRVFALCANGTIYKYNDFQTVTMITAKSSSDPTTLNASGYNAMVSGGFEVTGNPKKLFIFDGSHNPQVIAGDTTVRYTISSPAADWTGSNNPFGGIVHRGQLYAWGCPNNPHNVYTSNVSNMEDFSTPTFTQVYNIYPGEFNGIVCAAVFRGRLFFFKYPLGVYYLVDTDPDVLNWYVTKLCDDFGACSPQSAAIINNDLIIANNYGSLTSMTAALTFGDVLQKDIFYQTYCYRFAEQEVYANQQIGRGMLYYPARKQLYTTFQSYTGMNNNRISVVDYKDQQNPPKVAWNNKDQANCLFSLRDNLGLSRPFYGSSDGNLYQMGVSDRWVGSSTNTALQTGYTFDAQTPHMDFSQGNVYAPGTGNIPLGQQVKLYDFVEIEYEPTGDWNVLIDVLIDGKLRHTYPCNLGARSDLSEYPLNANPIDGLAGFFRRFQIHGQGRTISLRFYNSGIGQDVRLVRAVIYYRPSGQQQMVK